MEMSKLEGEAIPVTLDQIEAERERERSAARKDYFAGKFGLMTTVHRIEDIDRAADKAREQRVRDCLNRKAAA